MFERFTNPFDNPFEWPTKPFKELFMAFERSTKPFDNRSSSVRFCRSNGFPLVSILPFTVTIIFLADTHLVFRFTLRFTYAYPILFLSNYNRKDPQRSSCGSNILPQRSSCAFIMQPQRSSCGFQDSSSSDPQSAARRTSSCGRKKKFLRVHYFWAVL